MALPTTPARPARRRVAGLLRGIRRLRRGLAAALLALPLLAGLAQAQTPGVTITETSGSTTVTEASGTGNTDTYTVQLATQPSANVAVHITSSDENGATASVTPHPIFFTRTGADAWNVARTVTVTGVSDGIDQSGTPGSRTVTLTHTGTSTDSNYSGSLGTLDVTVTDDDDASLPVITVDQPAPVTEGDDITWTLTANPAPAADLTVNFWIGDAPAPSDFLDDDSDSDKSVTIGAGGTATWTVSTLHDRVDEPDAFVTLTVYPGSTNYALGDPSSDEVLVRDDDEPSNLVIVESDGSTSVTESGAGNTDTYTVRLAQQPTHNVTVALTTSSGAAKASPASLTFNRSGARLWSAPQTVTVTGVSDGIDQSGSPGSRKLTITHTGASTDADYAGSLGSVDVTVLDDDAFALVSFQNATYEGEEGGNVSFRLYRDGGRVSVAIPLLYRAGTAAADTDYTNGPASGMFLGGNALSEAVSIPTLADADIGEGDETFTVAIDGANLPAGYALGPVSTATATIKRLSLKTFGVSAGDLIEGAGKTVLLNLSRAFHPQEVSANARFDVDLTLGGTATRGTDYTLACGSNSSVTCANLASGTPRLTVSNTLSSGRVSNALKIVSTPDSVTEAGGETVTLAAGGASAQLRIVDPPASVTVEWASATFNTREGWLEGPPLRITPPGGEITVPLIFTDGTAEAGKDFAAITATTIPAGTALRALNLFVLDDDLYELDETFTVAIDVANLPAGVTAGSRTSVEVTILSDTSDSSTVQFAADAFEADEGQVVEAVLTLSNPLPVDATVTVIDTPLTATDFGIDYADGPYPVTFKAGETRAVLSIQTVADNADEGTEEFGLSIVSSGSFLPTGVTLGAPNSVTVSILDGPPTLYLLAPEGGYRMVEGNRNFVSFEARLSRPLGQDLQVVLYTSCAPADGRPPCAAPGEYPNLGNIRTIPAGSVEPVGPWVAFIEPDQAAEGEERFELSLQVAPGTPNPEGVTAGSATRPATATVIITDGAPLLPRAGFAAAASGATEGDGAAHVAVTITPAPASDLALTYTVTGTASASDFTIANSGALTVPAGRASVAIPVAVTDDSAQEDNETVILTLAGGDGYTLGRKTHTLTLTDNDTPVAAFARAASNANEDGGPVAVTVTLAPAPATAITLTYTVGGSAEEGPDFTITNSGALSVAPGSATAAIAVTPVDDDVHEGDEAVRLTLAGGAGYTVGSPGEHTLTLADDDPAPVPVAAFAAGSASADETAGAHGVTVTLSPAPSTALTLAYTVGGTATAGADFTIANAGALSVAPGESTATIPVALTDDTDAEGGETVALTLTGGAGYTVGSPGEHTLVILDDDAPPPTVSVTGAPAQLAEGAEITFTVARSGPRGAPLAVTLAIAESGNFVRAQHEGAHTVTIPTGAGSAPHYISTRDDNHSEPDGTVTASVLGGPGYAVGSPSSATVAVKDDDEAPPPLPEVSFTTPSASVNENAGAHAATLSLVPAPTTALTLSYSVGGTATRNSDYTLAGANSLSVSAGQGTVNLPVTLLDDSLEENDETVILTLTDGDGYTLGGVSAHTLTIVDNDAPVAPPAVSFAGPTGSVSEAAGTHNVPLHLSPTPTSALTLSYAVSGTATGGSDYTIAHSGSLTVSAGQSTVNIPVTLLDDSDEEGDETLILTLATGHGYTLGGHATHTLTLADDDGDTVVGPDRQLEAAIQARIDKTAANGDTWSERIWRRALAAVRDEDPPVGEDELEAADARRLADNHRAGGRFELAALWQRIADRLSGEPPPPVLPEAAFTAPAASANEGDGTHTATVTLNPAPASAFTLTWSVGGTASEGSDYSIAPSGSRTVAPGATSVAITVTLTDDTTPESAETVILTLTGGGAYTLGSPASHTLTIADDDAPRSQLETDIRARIDTDNDPDRVNDLKRALAALRGEPPPAGLAPLTLAEAEAARNRFAGLGWVVLTDLWTRIAAALSGPQDGEVTITADPAPVAEGDNIIFTLTRGGAATSSLTVDLTITESGNFIASSREGAQTATFGAGNATTTHTVPTVNDSTEEPGGSVTATVVDGAGYTAGNPASATVTVTDDDAPVTPAIALSAPGSVTEGATIAFTLTATPAPATPLAVQVAVTEAAGSDYVDSSHERTHTVTVPARATKAVLSIPTVGDNRDRRDGAVTATVQPGNAYTLSGGAATVRIADDDNAPPPPGTPAFSIEDAQGKEGRSITFTVRFSRAPGPDEYAQVDWHVRAIDGDNAATLDQDLPRRSGVASFFTGDTVYTFTLPTYDDNHHDPDEQFEVVLRNPRFSHLDRRTSTGTILPVAIGDGAAIGTITNHDPLPRAWLARLGRTVAQSALDGITTRISATRTAGWEGRLGGVALGTGRTGADGEGRDTRDQDGADAGHYAGAAESRAGRDGRRTHAGGTDGDGPGGVAGRGRGPDAEKSGSGRNLAGSIDGAGGESDHPGGMGGHGVDPDTPGGGSGRDLAGGIDSGSAESSGQGKRGVDSHGAATRAFDPEGAHAHGADPVTGLLPNGRAVPSGASTADSGAAWTDVGALLLDSHFTVTRAPDEAGGSLAFWGRGAQAAFRGEQDNLGIEGEVTTGLLGADYQRGPWLLGLTLTQSRGKGQYQGLTEDGADAGGRMASSLLAATPWAAWQAGERLALWGAAGYGRGHVTLRPDAPDWSGLPDGGLSANDTHGDGGGQLPAGEVLKADTRWLLAAAGLRADVFGQPDGPALAVLADALWTRTESEKTLGLGATRAAVSRLRLALEGSWALHFERAGSFTPTVHAGLRHDGGDAERGFGLELGGGLAWALARWGLSLDLQGRTLLTHDDNGVRDTGLSATIEFDPRPATELGWRLSLSQTRGGAATGGIEALFAADPLNARHASALSDRWQAAAAYGLPALRGRFTARPQLSLGLTGQGRDYSLGWRLTPAPGANAPDLSLEAKATRQESPTAPADHRVGLELRAAW